MGRGYVMVEVLLYVHRNRRFIRDGGPGDYIPIATLSPREVTLH